VATDSEIARLRAAIERAAASTAGMLACHPSADHQELSRQLSSLRARVAVAEGRDQGPGALRAELATLLSFAQTLEADAESCRSAIQDVMHERERQRFAAEAERVGLEGDRETLARRRDALQSTILQTAAGMARQYRGECRRTLPVFTLWDGLTVCSVSVSCPRRGFHFAKQWCVTLTRSQDVQIRRE
jgi:hypothetical protein